MAQVSGLSKLNTTQFLQYFYWLNVSNISLSREIRTTELFNMRITSPRLSSNWGACVCVCLCMCRSVICIAGRKKRLIIYPRWSDLSIEVLDGWIVLLHEMPRHELYSECRLPDPSRAEHHHLEFLHDWLGVLLVTVFFYWLCLLSLSAAGAQHHWLLYCCNEQLLIFSSQSALFLSLTWLDSQRISWGGPGHVWCLSQSFIINNNLSWSPTTPCPAWLVCRLEIPEIKQFIIEWNSGINDDHLKTVMFTSPLISIFKYL